MTSLESSTGNSPTVAAAVAQVGNGLPRAGAEFQVPGHTRTRGTRLGGQCHRRCRGNRGRRALLRNIGRLAHIQEALNYIYTVRSLVKRGVVSPAALSVPAYANVMACVVEFGDFFSAYGRKWA
jgi:phage tail tape-measure protein